MIAIIVTILIIVYTLKPQEKYSRLPPGNYSLRCNELEMYGNSLSATCLDFTGNPKMTMYDDANSCNYIQNIDGLLTCQPLNIDNILPYSDYDQFDEAITNGWI